MSNQNILKSAQHMEISHNVMMRVIDTSTGQVVQEVESHNAATNSMLIGIAHHLVGDFQASEPSGLHPSYSILSNYVPRYISLGTMGLLNQEQDENGLPLGIGDSMPNTLQHPEYAELEKLYNEAKSNLEKAKQAIIESACPCASKLIELGIDCSTLTMCNECTQRMKDAKAAYDKALKEYNQARDNYMNRSEEIRFTEYLEHCPGYGADGYNSAYNNGRSSIGLGRMYTSYDPNSQYREGDIVTYKDSAYKCIKNTATQSGVFSTNFFEILPDADQPDPEKQSVNIELCSPTFPRTAISYREIIPENEAELPRTIDVVFSAMISTGALKQFRPEGKDYIFITEAGLWSKNTYSPNSNNGLLAGYRIVPSNDNQLDMSVEANRIALKRSILKVKKNQVVQVIWKIQLGSISDIGARTITKIIHEHENIYPYWNV